jgi:hypothetical protein
MALTGANALATIATSSPLPSTRADFAYADVSGLTSRLGNGSIELGFDLNTKGALSSLVDKTTGYEFLRDRNAPRSLFRVALRRKDDRQIEWFDSRDARNFHVSKKHLTDGMTLVLNSNSFPNRSFAVRVEVSLGAGSSQTTWHMSVSGLKQDQTVYQLTCPILSGVMKVGEGLPGETLAVPRQGEGYLFRNPYPVEDELPLMTGSGPDTPQVGIGEIHGKYPGSFPVQFLLYYNNRAGLYVACHDSKQNVKGFDIGRMADWEPSPIVSISHFPREAMGRNATFEYDTIVGVFHGDWYNGADIYKAWATQQWWCTKKLWDRDIADWMRTGVGVFQMSNYHLPVLKLDHPMSQIADVVNDLSKDIGVPLLTLIFNFEGGGAWTGPAGFFPPREGEAPFRDALRRLGAAGNYGFVYMPGGNWYIEISSYTPPFNSWPQFEAEGRPNAIVDDQGQVPIARYYGGWQSTRLCPHMKFTERTTAGLVLGSLERGCTVVQIDNFPICTAEACYNTEHGHPLGYGPWWSDSWNHILAEVRRQAKERDRNSALTTEGISENFIPHLDMFDQRAGNMEYFGHWHAGDPMGGETIPLFSYIYSVYIGAYLAAYPECNRPEILYWTRSLGKCLAQGVVPTGGWYFPEPKELNLTTIDFYKKVVSAAAREGWKYLMFGEMLRPPKIDVPLISASYLKWTDDLDHMDPARRHVVKDYAVQHSAWRARDGVIGYFFANVSQARVEFDVELSSYSKEANTYNVDMVADGRRTSLLRQAKLSSKQRLGLDPLSVALIEVKPAAKTSKQRVLDGRR